MKIKKIFKRIFLVLLAAVALFAIITGVMYATTKPSLNRDWSLGQERAAHITIDDAGKVNIDNLRDFNWKLPKREALNYRAKDFTLDDITGLQVIVSHFAAHDAIAHVFLIFTMADGDDVAISVEGRREVGEAFTLLGGLTAKYDFMYVVGSAHDLLSLRQARGERLQRYTIDVPLGKVHKLFKALTVSINDVHTTPRLYHLFFKNCVNSLTREVHRLNSDYTFSFIISSFIPGSAGKMLTEMGVVHEAEEL